MKFTWDPAKNQSNETKHGVTFHEAATIFADALTITFPDPDHSELEYRYVTFGVSRFQRYLVVAHSDADDEVRIISAREMTKQERKSYEQ